MKELNHCPSTLADGFSTYSPTACKKLFDGQKVSHLLDFEIDEISKTSETMIAMRRISVSGAQEKFPAVIENGIIRISQTDERSRYILKPAPWDNTLYTRKQIPANEHLTMQIASQVYGIITADNGLCFTPHGDMVYITKRFDIAKDGSKYLMEDFASLVGKNEAEQGTYFNCISDKSRSRIFFVLSPVTTRSNVSSTSPFFSELIFSLIPLVSEVTLRLFRL